jgi:hypothetical protein
MFNFPIDAYINIINTAIWNRDEAETQLNNDITSFEESLHKILLHVDNSSEALSTLQTEANNVIADFKTKNEKALDALTVGIQMGTLVGKDGKPVELKSLTDIGLDIANLEEAADFAGKQLSYWISQGISNGMDETTEEMIAKYSSYLMKITSGGKRGSIDSDFKSNLTFEISDLSYNSLLEGLTNINALVDDYVNSVNQMNITNARDLTDMAGSFSEAAKMYEDAALSAETEEQAALYMEKAASMYKKAAEYEAEAQKIRDNLISSQNDAREKARSYAKEQLIDAFKNQNMQIFGAGGERVENIDKIWSDIHMNMTGTLDEAFAEFVAGNSSADLVAGAINDYIYAQFRKVNKDLAEASIKSGVYGWNSIGLKERQLLFGKILESSPSIQFATEFMHDGMKIDAQEMFEISGWDKFESKNKLAFLQAMGTIYDQDEVEELLKGMDISSDITSFTNFFGLDLENLSLKARNMYLRYLEDMFGKDTVYKYLEDTYATDSADFWAKETEMSRDIMETGMPLDEFMKEYADVIQQYQYLVDEYINKLNENSGYKGTRLNPLMLVGSAGAGGMPLGMPPARSNPAVNTEGPNGYDLSEADKRTATATEGTKKGIDTQNDKIDNLSRLLTAVLSRLNAGLNVNVVPTSTAGGVVSRAIGAFSKVTGE